MVTQSSGRDEHDRRLLAFIAQYRVATRESFGAPEFHGTSVDAVLKRLTDAKLLRANRSLPHNRNIYQLTRHGTKLAGVPPSLARPFGMQALLKHLGVLYLCLDSEDCRVRLSDEEVSQVLGTHAPDGVHVLASESGTVRLLYCYVPAPVTAVDSVIRRLRRHVYLVSQDPVIRQWVADRRYGYAVIVGNQLRRKAIERAVRHGDRRGHEPLAKLFTGWVYLPAGFGEVMGMPPAVAQRRDLAAGRPSGAAQDAGAHLPSRDRRRTPRDSSDGVPRRPPHGGGGS